MSNLSLDAQAEYPLRIDTALGPDALLVTGLHGVEGVSTIFDLHLDLLSTNAEIAPQALLRTPAAIRMRLPDGQERFIHGHIARFTQAGRGTDMVSYRAELVPWPWFLSLSQDCKIFQNLSVLEILEEVFKSQGYSDYKIKCTRDVPKREYCVQYRETHLNFISRLMEEEGLFYFFEHGENKHELVITDSISSVNPCPGASSARMAALTEPEDDVVTSLELEHLVHAGTVTLRDYDYLQPSLSLEASVSGDAPEEVYDYHPGRYTSKEAGERYARLHLESEEALRQVVKGQSTCRAFTSGFRFTLQDHYRSDANQAYLLLRVQHFATADLYHGTGHSVPLTYHNEFLAVPHGVPYRPSPRTPKPVVHGSQTALVVGPPGEELYVDKHGRIKVQFYWDRDGKQNEHSSCWVRVAQPWAGKGWGTISLPRIGNEVVVDFLEGDPDRPLVVGSVYNATQMPPYELPANQTQSGIKSRSSKGGGTANYNEIRFEDKKGAEQLLIHAEKDHILEVENNETHSVGANQQMTVEGDRTVHVKGSFTEKVDSGEERTVTGKSEETVTANLKQTVGGSVEQTVGGSVKQMVGGKLEQTVAGGVQVTTPAAIQMTAAGGVKIIAPAGVQVIAPGGQTQIDNFWDQYGLKNFTAYASRIGVSGHVNQAFGARMSVRGWDTRMTAFKVDTVGVLIDQKGVDLNKKTTSVGQTALCLASFGLYSIM